MQGFSCWLTLQQVGALGAEQPDHQLLHDCGLPSGVVAPSLLRQGGGGGGAKSGHPLLVCLQPGLEDLPQVEFGIK